MNCPHCNTHIDEHPASRCLAKWVAADVMEIVRGEYGEIIMYDRGIYESSEPPDYPNDIAAAWKVVEKLSKHYYVDIGVDDTGAQVQLDCLHVDSLGNTRWQLAFVESTRAPTAPLAICRAAIKAVQS